MSTYPECFVSTDLLQKIVKGMAKVPIHSGGKHNNKYLVFGLEEKKWLAIRAIDENSYFECYASGDAIDISIEGYASVNIKEFKRTIELTPPLKKNILRVGGIIGGRAGDRLAIQAGKKSNIQLPVYDSSWILNSFPRIEKEEELLAIRPYILKNCLLKNTVLALSHHKKDYESIGVLIKKQGECLRFCTADNNRLVLTEGRWSGISENISEENAKKLEEGIHMPTSFIEHLLGILPAVSKQAMVSLVHSKTTYSEGFTWVIFDDDVVFRVTSIQPANRFPQYTCFVDKDKKYVFEFNTADFLEAFKRLKPVSEFCGLKLFDEGACKPHIEVSGIRDADVFSREEIPYISFSGALNETFMIGARTSFLVDALSRVPTKKVLVEFDGERLPFRISPVFEEKEKEKFGFTKYIYVAMPIDLRVTFRK